MDSFLPVTWFWHLVLSEPCELFLNWCTNHISISFNNCTSFLYLRKCSITLIQAGYFYGLCGWIWAVNVFLFWSSRLCSLVLAQFNANENSIFSLESWYNFKIHLQYLNRHTDKICSVPLAFGQDDFSKSSDPYSISFIPPIILNQRRKISGMVTNLSQQLHSLNLWTNTSSLSSFRQSQPVKISGGTHFKPTSYIAFQ